MSFDRYSEMATKEASKTIDAISNRYRRISNLELVLKAYVVIGIVGALVGAMYIVFDVLKIELDQKQQLALVFVGVSISLSLMSYLVLQIRRQKEASETESVLEHIYTAELIEAWANFEIVSREVLNSDEEKFNRFSPRSIISKLHQDGRISDSDVASLQSALEARNMLVHGKERFPVSFLRKMSADLGEIVARLSQSKRRITVELGALEQD